MMKVTLDHEGCIGCGLAEVVQTPISEEEKDGARLAEKLPGQRDRGGE